MAREATAKGLEHRVRILNRADLFMMSTPPNEIITLWNVRGDHISRPLSARTTAAANTVICDDQRGVRLASRAASGQRATRARSFSSCRLQKNPKRKLTL